MAVNCFGSGVVGLSVHASTHTPPSSWLQNGRKNIHTLFTHAEIFLSPRVAKHPRTAICILPVAFSSTDKNRAAFPHAGPPLSVPFFAGSDCLPTHRYSFVWGAHGELRAVRFHPRFSWKEPFTSSAVCSPYRSVWLCNFRHFNAEIGTVVLPPCLLFSWDCVILLLGVVLATRGPRMTQKSFSLLSCDSWINFLSAMVGLRTVGGAGMLA